MLIRYTKEQLYGVIADVERYPQFVPFCTGSNLYSVKTLGEPSNSARQNDNRVKPWLEAGYSGETHLLESELVVGFKSFEEKYISHVECRKWDTVKVSVYLINVGQAIAS
jgi:coenzyme Q-binding protein COQ10